MRGHLLGWEAAFFPPIKQESHQGAFWLLPEHRPRPATAKINIFIPPTPQPSSLGLLGGQQRGCLRQAGEPQCLPPLALCLYCSRLWSLTGWPERPSPLSEGGGTPATQ